MSFSATLVLCLEGCSLKCRLLELDLRLVCCFCVYLGFFLLIEYACGGG